MHCLKKINPDLEKRIHEIGVPSTSTFKTIKGETLIHLNAKTTNKFGKYSKSKSFL